LHPVFGMAEATLAVTFPAVGEGMTVDAVDRHSLEHDRRAVAPAADASTESVRRLAKLGRPLEGFELRIVDPATGAVRGEREVGELELRSPSVTPGYYRNAEATAEAFRGGWFHSQDLGFEVEDSGQSFFVVTGRSKNIAKVRGETVSLDEMDRVLRSIPQVEDAACAALPHRLLGDEIVAAVVFEGQAVDVLPQLRAAFAAAVLPRRIVSLRAIPRTATGKVLRPQLAQLLAQPSAAGPEET